MVISCKDYTATLVIPFITSRKAIAVSLTTCPAVISAVMTMMSGNPSTTKAGAAAIANIIWRVSTREAAINCTASKSSDVAWCTTGASLQTGGEPSTTKAGFSATRQSIILLGFGGIIIEDQTTRSFYWRKQNVVQLLHQIRTRHRRVKQPTGGQFSISKYLQAKRWFLGVLCYFYLQEVIFCLNFLSERTHGLFVQMVTLSKVSTGAVAIGCITSKRLNAVNRIRFQIDMRTAITRISYLRLITKDWANASKRVTMWLESTEEAVIDSIVLRRWNVARWL